MVPFFDMANHNIDSQLVHRYVEKSEVFLLSTRQKVFPGQQLQLFYGPEPNWRVCAMCCAA